VTARPQKGHALQGWQALAKALMPAVYGEFCAGNSVGKGTLAQFFCVLLSATRKAHRTGDDEFLLSAYAFAHWCMAQPDRELWNAAGVAFFEYLFDDLDPATVVPWLAPRTCTDILPLVGHRLGEQRVREIERAYAKRQTWQENVYPSVISRAERRMRSAS
jgi:hypothetical protein